MELPSMAPSAAALAVLGVLSAYDIRYREVPTAIALGGLALVAALRAVAGLGAPLHAVPTLGYMAIDAMIVGTSGLLAFLGLLGWGDVISLAIVASAQPMPTFRTFPFPVPLVTLIYYVAAMACLMCINAVHNVAFHRDELSKLPPRRRLIYMFIARPKKAREILEKPGWWYPLGMCGSGHYTFDIYMDPPDIAKQVEEAVKRGCLALDSTVWVTYGVPGVPIIAASFAVATFLGAPWL